jgi:chromate reductase, NAD(P)H dehydrogenase (quinone)
MNNGNVHLLLISGSLRRGSTNTGLLRTARELAPEGVTAVLYQGMAELPQFNPDDDGPSLPPRAAADLRAQIRWADAVLFSTPEYAGALPGSFKNVLDWAVGDDQPGSMNGKPVAWVNVSSRGAAHAHESLRRVLGYLGAIIVESASLNIPVASEAVDDEGLIPSEQIRTQVAVALSELVARAAPGRRDAAVVAGG